MIGQWLAWFVPEEERLDLRLRLERTSFFCHVFFFGGWVVAGARLPARRSELQLPDSLTERHGYLFSHCDSSLWQSLQVAWVERLLACPEHLDQLPGDFSFARLLPDGTAEVVRACGGQGPWHYGNIGGRVVVSTRLDWIATSQHTPVELDLLATVMSGQGMPSALLPRSVLSGTLSVRPGHCATVSPYRLGPLVPYFRPAPLRLPPADAAHQTYAGARLRELLLRNVDAELAPEGNLVLCSGGIDSSLLIGVAAHLGLSLHATTLLPPREDPFLAREERFVEAMTSQFLSHDRVNCTPEIFDSLIACDGLAASAFFGGLPRRRVLGDSRITTAMIGYGADELFGVFRLADLVNATSPLGVLDAVRACPARYSIARRWIKRRRSRRHPLLLPANLHGMFSASLKEEYLQFYASEERLRADEPAAFRLTEALRYYDHSGTFAEQSAVLGIRLVLPFLQREVLELAYCSPPRELFRDGRTKAPIRAAAVGLVPRVLSERIDSGHWQNYPGRDRPAGVPLDRVLDPFLDKAWIAEQYAVDAGAACKLRLVEQLAKAQERLSHDRDAFFKR